MHQVFLPHDHGQKSISLQTNMPNKQNAGNICELFKIMSDETRIQIFWWLCHCEECVINISALVSMSSPAISHHLKILKDAGLIISRREGKEVYYTAAKTTRSQTLHDMIERTMEITCPAEERFKESQCYDSLVQTIYNVHEFLTTNIEKRYTTKEVSSLFHINQTTLKSEFKTTFGQPIASYMKEYRIKRAAEYLVQTDESISLIAKKLGYENQGKFAQVFKDITGFLPKDYRKKSKEV